MADLGPFKVGQRPVIVATLTDITGGAGISTATEWTIKAPSGEVVVDELTSSGDLTNPSTNVWRFIMPVIEEEGTYYVKVLSTAGLISAQYATLYVEDVDGY